MNATSTVLLPILVGIDGSAPSDLALDWAAAQAAAEGRSLVLVTAATLPTAEPGAWLATHGIDQARVRAQLKEWARAVYRRRAARVRETYPDLDIQHDFRFGDPREALLETPADLVVVGTRGVGPVRRLLLGSVASTVVKHATRPTVVVRASQPAPGEYGVLVGIAGDAGDAATIDLAFRLAAARELPVTAFHSVWDAVGLDETHDAPADEPRYAAERLLISKALESAEARYPQVQVHGRIGRGFADERLIHASRKAELVVIGHRRKPFLNELIYGSAAPRIVEHATCSVAVVPYHEQEERDPAPAARTTA